MRYSPIWINFSPTYEGEEKGIWRRVGRLATAGCQRHGTTYLEHLKSHSNIEIILRFQTWRPVHRLTIGSLSLETRVYR